MFVHSFVRSFSCCLLPSFLDWLDFGTILLHNVVVLLTVVVVVACGVIREEREAVRRVGGVRSDRVAVQLRQQKRASSRGVLCAVCVPDVLHAEQHQAHHGTL